MHNFVHLHVHTQYSLLDGQASIKAHFKKAAADNQPALAITDHGNMYGVKEFLKVAKKYPEIKPIIGCEIYVTRHYDHKIKDKDHRGYYHLILLAKNYNGYKNLMKIVSTGHIEGKYYDKPRVAHEVVEKYAQDLICCSACIAGEVPRNIIAGDMDGAEKAIQWHKNIFGEDYYLEVQLHKTEIPDLSTEVYDTQIIANKGIFELAEKHNIKVVATNDVHFADKEDGEAHDRLICLTTNAFVDDKNRMRYTQQEYLKSEEEMLALFPEHPEVISNTLEVAEKIDSFKIDKDPILPKFDLPEEFLADIDTYLEKGLKPDIWWIDAGWYPCNNDWPTTGNWYPNPDHFPNGMGPVGKKLLEEGNGYFVHRCGELLGIGIASDETVRVIAATKPGAGEDVLLALTHALTGENVIVEVASENHRAMRFYDRLGFIKTAELSAWYQVL